MPEKPDFITPADEDDDEDHPFGTPDDDGWMSVKRAGEPDPDGGQRKQQQKLASKPKPRATRRRR